MSKEILSNIYFYGDKDQIIFKIREMRTFDATSKDVVVGVSYSMLENSVLSLELFYKLHSKGNQIISTTPFNFMNQFYPLDVDSKEGARIWCVLNDMICYRLQWGFTDYYQRNER